MSATLALELDLGARVPRVELHLPELVSRVVGARVEDRDGLSEDAVGGEVALDIVEARLAKDVTPGVCEIELERARVVIGLRYEMVDPIRRVREVLTPIAVTSHVVTLRDRIIYEHAAGTPIRGSTLALPIKPTWLRQHARAAELGQATPAFRVVWSIVVDEVARRVVTELSLVHHRRSVVVTVDDVERRSPGWLSRFPNAHRLERGQALLDEAFDWVVRHARATQRDLTDPSRVRELVTLRAAVEALEHGASLGAAEHRELALAEQRFYAAIGGVPASSAPHAPTPTSDTTDKILERPLRADQVPEDIRALAVAGQRGEAYRQYAERYGVRSKFARLVVDASIPPPRPKTAEEMVRWLAAERDGRTSAERVINSLHVEWIPGLTDPDERVLARALLSAHLRSMFPAISGKSLRNLLDRLRGHT